ncbi:MAG: hypothetical protein Q4A35_04450 [Candidatus Gracilibacteria bacterium]|nr:hypothetical protein [Candidatus Gracilibacteria bacterium]
MKNLSLTSDRQRNFVAGGIVIAIIGTFFPAIRASFMSASLAQSSYGFGILALLIFAFACIFFQPEIIKIIKNKFDKSIDSNTLSWAAVILLGFTFIWVVGIIREIYATATVSMFSGFFHIGSLIGIGIYVVLLATIFSLASLFFFEKVDSSIKTAQRKIQENTKNNDSENSPEKNSDENSNTNS